MVNVILEKDVAVNLFEYLSREITVIDHTLSEEFQKHYSQEYGEEIPSFILEREKAQKEMMQNVLLNIARANEMTEGS